MTKLIITRGLPGSGKTTWARQQPAWRVNRDDLRNMLTTAWPHGDTDHEDLLSGIQNDVIGLLLADGREVIVDDTNLRADVVRRLRFLATAYRVEFHVEDFTHVPLDVCIERDAARPEPVGEHVIRGMWAKYLAQAEARQS